MKHTVSVLNEPQDYQDNNMERHCDGVDILPAMFRIDVGHGEPTVIGNVIVPTGSKLYFKDGKLAGIEAKELRTKHEIHLQ